MSYWVYILANRPHGSIYIGVASDLVRRVWEHREGKVPGHTARYGIRQLVYYEEHRDVEQAILREKKLKRWKREFKDNLIAERNSEWRDLGDEIAS